MTPEQIDRLSELCEKAPGKWVKNVMSLTTARIWMDDIDDGFYLRCEAVDANGVWHLESIYNFIAESRTAIPELISHVKDLHSAIRAHTDAALRLQSEIAKRDRAIERCKSEIHDWIRNHNVEDPHDECIRRKIEEWDKEITAILEGE